MAQHDPTRSSPAETGLLPARIPLFPLRGALLLPGGDLPLNIFEPRYCAMMQHALRGDRLIGMIQPRCRANVAPLHDLYDIGCIGRITQYQETDDGRYLISLRGVSRFSLAATPQLTAEHYMLGEIDCTAYADDLVPPPEPPAHLCRVQTRALLDRFLARENLQIDWEQAASVADSRFYTLLAMVAPLAAAEKQLLLEAPDCAARWQLFMQLVEIAVATRPDPGHDDDRADKPPRLH